MCGRYMVSLEEEIIEMREIISEVNERYLGTPELARMKMGEIFPTETVPVLVGEKETVHARLLKWGFPNRDRSGVIINARAESVLDKPLFHSSLFQRRCVIPSTGFYEWLKGNKEKYLLRLPNSPMLYMAGIFSNFKDKEGKINSAFVIFTTAANESVSGFHDRMPFILEGENKNRWLLDTHSAINMIRRPCESMLIMRPAG